MNNRKTKRNNAFIKTLKSIHNFRDKMDIEKQRKSQETLGILFSHNKGINYETFEIDGMYVERIHKNKTNDTKHIILYCHGGAYITGNLAYARILGSKLAYATDIDVLAIEYRLAPENPYPAALEDALKAWDYLISKGYTSDNIALVGESAGGNLVLSLMHYLKSKQRKLPVALVCMSPWADLSFVGKTHETKKDIDPILTTEFLTDATKVYAVDTDLTNPLVSPIYGDFEGFPPTLIQVGSDEILLSDSITIKNKLIESGVSCTMEVWKGMWHVFQMFPMKKANRAMKNISAFLASSFI